MGRRREPLPLVPLFKLSRQQSLVYNLAKSYGTGEISKILSIPEKQVRQVYSAIRLKAREFATREFANRNVPPVTVAEPAHYYDCPPGEKNLNRYDFIRKPEKSDSRLNLTESEHNVMEHVRKGISAREISALTGKSVQAVKKTYQRAKRKLCNVSGYFDSNCIIKTDTSRTYVKINFDLIISAMDKIGLTRDQTSRDTGISPERMAEIEREGTLSYDELFALIRRLSFNPYGPSEKDDLLLKLHDTHWISMIRSGKKGNGGIVAAGSISRKNTEKSRYRNRVMYYGTASYHYNSHDRNKPISPVEERQ